MGWREHNYFEIISTDDYEHFKNIEVVKRFKKYVRKPNFEKLGIIVSGYKGWRNKGCSEYDWHYLLEFSAN